MSEYARICFLTCLRMSNIVIAFINSYCLIECNLLHNLHRKCSHCLFSRNQLTVIPPFIKCLQALEVFLASHNKLVSLPEEIGELKRLMEIVSLSLYIRFQINYFSFQKFLPYNLICEILNLHIKNRMMWIFLCRKLWWFLYLFEQYINLHKCPPFFQDVSCNEISHLPSQIGDLKSMQCLNVRRNLLIELPVGKFSKVINFRCIYWFW